MPGKMTGKEKEFFPAPKEEILMRRRLSALFLSMLLVAVIAAPGWSGTLDALPQWPDSAMYGVVNLEKPNEMVQRVVNSYLFKVITAIQPDIKMA